MKTLFAGILIASTMAIAAPVPASALGIHVGPRGVGVRLGRPGYGRGFHRRPFVRHHFYRHGRRF